MTELKNIKIFLFDKAQYRVSDSMGNVGLLIINYKERSFLVKGTSLEKSALREISDFANDLLTRKSGKNFAKQK